MRPIDADVLKEEVDMAWRPDMAVSEIWNVIDDAPTVSGWVSVKDRTPEEKGWYMVYAPGYSGGSSSGLDSHNGVMFAKWSGKTWSIEVGYHKRPGCVRQWMPLPEPPEVSKDAD